MTVYVDQLRSYDNVQGEAARYGRRWCHLTADSLEELHAMADRIGLKRAWFQPAHRLHQCHYDLVPAKRAAAVRAGAVEVDGLAHARALHADGRADLLAPDEVRALVPKPFTFRSKE